MTITESITQLITELQKYGVTDTAVLKAIEGVPREIFMSQPFKNRAYENVALPIGRHQTISQPLIVGLMTQALEVTDRTKVLEIGTGSGYQTAVLLELKAKVFSIERQRELYKKTKLFLPKLNYKPKSLIFGDGYIGLEDEAPFDGIIVTAGAPFVPKPLLSQLKIGGRLVIPVGDSSQIMTLFIRKAEKEFEKQEFGDFRFVPMLEKKN